VTQKNRIHAVYAGQWSGKLDLTVSSDLLVRLGKLAIKILAEEAERDFAKRGWSLNDPQGGPPLNKSFSYSIRGNKTLEIHSTFWGLKELMSHDIPARKLTWLTQEAKLQHPERYKFTQGEIKRGKTQKGNRMPLIVPLRAKNGDIVLRMAPFSTENAWVHPGIAKFTFLTRALKKAREAFKKLIADDVMKNIAKNLRREIR